jgi:hypothetical protein
LNGALAVWQLSKGELKPSCRHADIYIYIYIYIYIVVDIFIDIDI